MFLFSFKILIIMSKIIKMKTIQKQKKEKVKFQI